jgi:hypothetical protein
MASLTGLIAVAVLTTLLLATPAASTHEIDHPERYAGRAPDEPV